MMNLYKVYGKGSGADAFTLYETVEDAPGGTIIETYLCQCAHLLLKRNGGVVEIRDHKGDVLVRFTRNVGY